MLLTSDRISEPVCLSRWTIGLSTEWREWMRGGGPPVTISSKHGEMQTNQRVPVAENRCNSFSCLINHIKRLLTIIVELKIMNQ